jgi:hypothetical protein
VGGILDALTIFRLSLVITMDLPIADSKS